MENQEELEEFNYEEVKNILFKKLKELSKRQYVDADYIDCCKLMTSIATLLLNCL